MKNKLVLVVDDEKDIREIISYNLEQENIRTIQAEDGDTALMKLAENPDLMAWNVWQHSQRSSPLVLVTSRR